jgi:Ca2+-binding EF-hand superfamily protein
MKPARITFAALCTCAAIALALDRPALAQPAGDEALRKAFAQADANSDGMLDLDGSSATIYLFRRRREPRRSITITEAIVMSPGMTDAAFRSADRNGDGKLSVGEAAAAKVIVFFDVDTDRNGVISIDELVVHERRVAAK